MGIGRPPYPRTPQWGKAFVISELKSGKSMRQVCIENTVGYKWVVLKDEIEEWRARDPEFRQDYDEILDQLYPNRARKGTTPKAVDDDWKIKFCEDLFETGSRLKAADLSPYVYETIYRKLDPHSPQYDKEFADLVHATEMKMVAEFEGGFVESFRSDKLSPKDKAWIARSWLERRAPERWGRQVEMIHSGKIVHEVKKQEKSREQLLEELVNDQKQFIATSRKALPESRENVVDVEVLNEHSESRKV